MSKPEHVLRQEGVIKRPADCTCHDGYWMRNLIDPTCHYHGDYAQELRELITELCDALENHNLDHLHDDLLQRARKATKCQP
jgi:predicted small metal-binding protein